MMELKLCMDDKVKEAMEVASSKLGLRSDVLLFIRKCLSEKRFILVPKSRMCYAPV